MYMEESWGCEGHQPRKTWLEVVKNYIYLVIYLVRPNQSTLQVGLGPSGHQSISETFFIFLCSSNLFLNVFTEPAEITSSLRLFHLFTILCEKKYFVTSSLKLSFASFRECPLVLSLLSARKNEFHGMADTPLDILNISIRSERFLLSSRDINFSLSSLLS